MLDTYLEQPKSLMLTFCFAQLKQVNMWLKIIFGSSDIYVQLENLPEKLRIKSFMPRDPEPQGGGWCIIASSHGAVPSQIGIGNATSLLMIPAQIHQKASPTQP